MDVADDHDDVAQLPRPSCEPSRAEIVASTPPKFMPTTVTTVRLGAQSGALLGRLADMTGVSKVNAAVAVPTKAETVIAVQSELSDDR